MGIIGVNLIVDYGFLLAAGLYLVIALTTFTASKGQKRKATALWLLLSLSFVGGWLLSRPYHPKSFPWRITVDASAVPYNGGRQFFIEELLFQTEYLPPIGKTQAGWGGQVLDYGKSTSTNSQGYKLTFCKAVVRDNQLPTPPVTIESTCDLPPGPLQITLKLQSDGHGRWEIVPQ